MAAEAAEAASRPAMAAVRPVASSPARLAPVVPALVAARPSHLGRNLATAAVLMFVASGAVAYRLWPEATVPQQAGASTSPKPVAVPFQLPAKPAVPAVIQTTVAAQVASHGKFMGGLFDLPRGWTRMENSPAAMQPDWLVAAGRSPSTETLSAAPVAPSVVPPTVAVIPPAPPVAPAVVQPPIDLSQYHVTTIMATPRGNKAVINGHVMGEGQEIDKATVISIGSHEVELEIGGRRVKINL
jgi:hypothetical protein